MRIKGKVKEATGFLEEEIYEHGKDADSKRNVQEGRNLRNEGRVDEGKAPKATKSGTDK